jgi:Tol biopolymer transport system component
VLYEMLTGERAFRRDTTPETMTAILRDEPPDAPAGRSPLTPALDRIVRHCLEKQPAERFQTARDVAFALDALSGSGSGAAARLPAADGRGAFVRERIAWSVLTLALAAALVFLGLRPGVQVAAPPLYIASLLLPDGITLPGIAHGRKIAIAPDGRHLAFIAGAPGRHNQVWLQSLDRASAVAVEGSDGAVGPFWSPDSRFVAYRLGTQLMKVPAAGGPATIIGSTVGSGTWSRDDVIIVDDELNTAGTRGSLSLRLVSTTGADGTEIMRASGGNTIAFPEFLPDGQHFVFGYGSQKYPDTGLYLGRLGSSDRTLLVRARYDMENVNAIYASGHMLSVRDQTISARVFDPQRFVLSTEIAPIAGPVENAIPGSAAFSVSQTGVLVYQPSSSKGGSRIAWFDRSGRQLSAVAEEAEYSNLELSPDGSQLLVSVPDRVIRTRDVWVVDVARGVRTRLTFDPSDERSAVWTADGKGIVYTTRGLELYTKPLGAGAETPLVVDRVSKDPGGFTPDGRFLMYRASSPTGRNDLWVRPMTGDQKPYPFLSTPFDESAAMFSPDGRWVAYVSDESGKLEVYVTAFPSGEGKWQISTAGGRFPRWRRDGTEMFYLAPDNKLMSVKVSAAAGRFAVAAAVPLFQTAAVPGPGTSYDVSPDGERFVINTASVSTAPPSLTIVVNWPQLLPKQGSK